MLPLDNKMEKKDENRLFWSNLKLFIIHIKIIKLKFFPFNFVSCLAIDFFFHVSKAEKLQNECLAFLISMPFIQIARKLHPLRFAFFVTYTRHLLPPPKPNPPII